MDKIRRSTGIPRTVFSTVVRAIPVVVTLWITLTETVDLQSATLILLFTITFYAAYEYVETYLPALSYRDEQLSTFFRGYLGLVEKDIEAVADGDVSVRANIMRPSSKSILGDPTHSIAFYSQRDDYDEEEFELEFDTGQGCVGHVDESGDQKFAISPPHVESWPDGWSTSRRQDRVTGGLNTIIGTPIFDPAGKMEEPVAVLIIDSEHPMEEFVSLENGESLEDVDFGDTAVAERAAEYASDIGVLL